MAKTRGISFTLRALQWLVRCLQLGCAIVILAIYSYSLAALSSHGYDQPASVRAVEGIAGAALAYALFGMLLLCCLAGRTLACFAAMCLDLAFLSAYIYVAVVNKGGSGSCNGIITIVFATDGRIFTGDRSLIKMPSFEDACNMETACLAIAIIAIFLYLVSMIIELALGRLHQRQKRLSNSSARTHLPLTQPPNDSYQPEMASPSNPPSASLLSRILGRNRNQQPVSRSDASNLPKNPRPNQIPPVHCDLDGTSGPRPNELHAQPPYNQMETPYANTGSHLSSPTTPRPVVTGHTFTAGDNAVQGHTHSVDSYTHSGDHYGHSGDDDHYRRNNNESQLASTTTAAMPNPYENPYEEANRGDTKQQMPPPYSTFGRRHYDDGIYCPS